MRPIIIVMLAVQIALILVTALSVVQAKPSPGRPRPIWSTLAIALIITASTSYQISDKHHGSDGGELLEYGSGVLAGMALMCLMVLLRQLLGRDSNLAR